MLAQSGRNWGSELLAPQGPGKEIDRLRDVHKLAASAL
jgi:hypothetical protein